MSTEPPVPPVPDARHVPDARQEPDARQSGPRDLEPTDDATPLPDPAESARSALARARKSARDKGFRPGMKPAPNARRIGGMPPSRTSPDDRYPALLGTQLDRLLQDRGWTADVTVGSVMGRWAEIVGRDLAAHVRPVSFEGTVLTVQADSTAWANRGRGGRRGGHRSRRPRPDRAVLGQGPSPGPGPWAPRHLRLRSASHLFEKAALCPSGSLNDHSSISPSASLRVRSVAG